MQTPNLPPAIGAALCNLIHAIMTNGHAAAEPDGALGKLAAEVVVPSRANAKADAAAAFKAAEPEMFNRILPTQALLDLGYTVDEMIEEGWDEEGLVNAGYITIETPKSPAAATGTQSPASQAAQESSPDAADGEQTNTGAGATQAKFLDSDGVNWDERIHSSGRTRTTAGAWTKKKGVKPEDLARITEELRAANVEPFTPLKKPGAPPPPAAKKPGPPPPKAAAAAPGPVGAYDISYPESLGDTQKDYVVLCKYTLDKTLPPLDKADHEGVYAMFDLKGLGAIGTPDNLHLVDLVYQEFRKLRGEV